MALLPDWNISDIKELIKKGCTIEAEEKIMDLRRTLLSFKEENINQLFLFKSTANRQLRPSSFCSSSPQIQGFDG